MTEIQLPSELLEEDPADAFERDIAEWAAWFTKPLAERQAIQDKVRATFAAYGAQAGMDMMKVLGRPNLPADMMTQADVVKVPQQSQGEGTQRPSRRLDH